MRLPGELGKINIEPFGSIWQNEDMGRPKGFNREEVLEKVIPEFWKNGFADTSLQQLEKCSGVNKSGLYSEFKDKDDLYLACLKHYTENSPVDEILTKPPLGWANVEALLKSGITCSGSKGCFVVSSLRELSILPSAARALILEHATKLKNLLAQNLKAAKVRGNPEGIAEMILTFSNGLCLGQNIDSKSSALKKAEDFIEVIKKL
jgi:AcrR family transcriptional regulator